MHEFDTQKMRVQALPNWHMNCVVATVSIRSLLGLGSINLNFLCDGVALTEIGIFVVCIQ